MSQVIDKIKEKYPEYAQVPDEQLTLKVAEKYPTYLDADPQFKTDYQQLVISKSVQQAQEITAGITRVLGNPAAGSAAQFGRERLAQGLDQPTPPPEPEKGVVGKAWEFLSTPLAKIDLSPKSIVEAARQFTAAQLNVPADRLTPKPTDESVANAVHSSKTAGLTIGVVKGLEDMDNFFTSPIGVATLGIGFLPKVAQRLIALGFSAQMVQQAPQISRELGAEFGKPESERDYSKIGNLVTQAATTTGFTVLGVLHGLAPRKPAAVDTAKVKESAPATGAALESEQNAIAQKVAAQPASDPKITDATPAKGPIKDQKLDGGLPPEKQEQLDDSNKYQQLVQDFRSLLFEKKLPADGPEGAAIFQAIEALKNKYGGVPPKPPEYITHAAYTDEGGTTHVGANHPEILQKLGVEGLEERDSRNTPQFGYRTNLRPFITREEAGPVATASGQNMEAFDPGESVHSDQIQSVTEPGKSLGEAQAAPPVPAGAPPVIQAGAAHVTEIPETGAGGEKYGISQQVREERAQAGQVDPVLPGKGETPPDSIERGRKINAEDPGAPERFMQQFEGDPEKNFSKAMIASVRAHGEALARAARQIEEQHGTASPEYQAAKDALSAWDKRTKPIQTEWHASGVAQQGWTDLDTGSVAGLERERTRLTDKAFTPEETERATELAQEVRGAEAETGKAAEDLQAQLQEEINQANPEVKAEADHTRETAAVEDANKAQETVDQLQAEIRALDAAYKTVREAAVDVSKTETKKRVAEVVRKQKVAKVQLQAAQKALKAAQEVTIRAAKDAAKSEAKATKYRELKTQADATNKALEAAHKTVREAAAAAAEAENKTRAAQAGRDKQVAAVQAKAAAKAQRAAWDTVRDAARRAAAAQRKMLGDGAIPVWERARKYLVSYDAEGRQAPSAISFDDLRNKIAADLGMTTDQVTHLLSRSNRVKSLAADAWLKQQRERNVKTKAKIWVQGLDMPGYEKFIRALPRVLFQIRVGFHGTVALGTHAPAVVLDPRFWGTYVRNFGKMYHMVGSRSFYEAQMEDLLRRKNFADAKRGGLVVDPFKHEDFKSPGLTTEMADKVSKAMANTLGVDSKWFTKMGERGYSVLKVLRMDMFDQHWDALPRSLRTQEMAQAIADGVNHITGVVQTPAPFKAELVAFAPKLQMSRAALIFGDPLRAARTGVRAAVGAGHRALGISGAPPEVTPAETHFAIEQLKSKAYIAATMGSLLALNQGILSMSGDKQKINFTDPFRSDFGKFKVAGLNASYGNPLITMARLPIRLGTLAVGPGGKLRKIIYPDEDAARITWEYLRSQASPFFSLMLDQVFREDWQKRQLPNSERPQPKRLAAQGIGPYTQEEYWTQQALPIPFQEFMREVWADGFGMNDEQIQSYTKAALSTLFMAGTGGRVSQDMEATE